MCADWRNESHLNTLTKRIDAAKKIDPSGKVTFQGLDYFDALAALLTAINLDISVPRIERVGIVRAGLRSAAKQGAITKETAIGEISKAEQAFLVAPRRSFVIRSSLTMPYRDQLRSRHIEESRIHFSLGHPKRFDIAPLESQYNRYFAQALRLRYVAMRVTVQERSPLAAGECALDDIDLLRSIWNLFWNLRLGFRMSQVPKPINVILRGPIHTIHDSTGQLACEDVFYEAYGEEPPKPAIISNHWDKCERFEQRCRLRIQRCAYSDALKRCLRLYVRAMDQWDYGQAFVGLWTSLEALTNTPRAKYDITVKRAAFLSKDYEFDVATLLHLRQVRNDTIHHGVNNYDGEALVFQLKRFVEALIRYHILNRCAFESIDDACEQLDMPAGIKQLNRKRNFVRRALRFRSKWRI